MFELPHAAQIRNRVSFTGYVDVACILEAVVVEEDDRTVQCREVKMTGEAGE